MSFYYFKTNLTEFNLYEHKTPQKDHRVFSWGKRGDNIVCIKLFINVSVFATL